MAGWQIKIIFLVLLCDFTQNKPEFSLIQKSEEGGGRWSHSFSSSFMNTFLSGFLHPCTGCTIAGGVQWWVECTACCTVSLCWLLCSVSVWRSDRRELPASKVNNAPHLHHHITPSPPLTLLLDKVLDLSK